MADKHDVIAQRITEEICSLDMSLRNRYISSLLRHEYGDAEEDLREAESINECWVNDTLKLTPFDLPAAHHTVEYLYEWRKRWDLMKTKLDVAREELERYAARLGGVAAAEALAEIDKLGEKA